MELPLPRIPTDNLYKFIALSGVFLMIVGYGLPAIGVLRDQAISRPFIREQIQRLQRQREVRRQLEAAIPAYNKQNVKLGNALRDSALRVEDSLDRTKKAFEEREDELTEDRDNLKTMEYVGLILALIGSFSAIWGFHYWYERLQKPLDEIVRREAAGLKATDRANGGSD